MKNTIRIMMVICAAAIWVSGAAAAGDEDTYPLDTCVVSGAVLGSHGKPFVLKYKGREVRLCCGGCKGDFMKTPKVYLAAIDKARKSKATQKKEQR
tara:strand:+ start:487 stop:774 length:288 start_codon:yes stop_codon:yes gene_type:complete